MTGRMRTIRTCAVAPAGTVVLAGTVLLAACGSGSATAPGNAAPAAGSATPATSAAPSTPAAHRSAAGVVPLPVAQGAGRLPQTMAKPATGSPAFRAMITDLWAAVRTGQAALGRPAFFPVAAYKQVKAIADPAADWRSRLWREFGLDVRAAHRLLGPDARAARLIRVVVDSAGAAWVGPGACYNREGYWHVAGSRVVYRLHGQVRSFGIASLISWRGVWYVVHFGGVVRPAVGMVDAPAAGPGTPGPQGGC